MARPRVTPLVAERFWEKVDRRGPEECWPWLGSISTEGYGRLYVERHMQAHRVAYELLIETIPDGLAIDHLCRNRSCVNPAHMEPVTWRENIRRGEGMGARYARRTHCSKGHPLTGENLLRQGTRRRCLTCKRAEGRKYWSNRHPRQAPG